MTRGGRGLYPDEIVHALREEGVAVRLLPGWRSDSGRGGGAFSPVHGVLLGHTGCTDVGRSVTRVADAMGGPTAHGVIGMDGTVWLATTGRARHTGQGSVEVLRAVAVGERAGRPGLNTVDGNRHFYGFKAVHSGDPQARWPRAQVRAMARVSAALCLAHEWTGGIPPVLAQWEWSRDGVGPVGLDMFDLRGMVWSMVAAKVGDSRRIA